MNRLWSSGIRVISCYPGRWFRSCSSPAGDVLGAGRLEASEVLAQMSWAELGLQGVMYIPDQSMSLGLGFRV